jgi:hypothetical protein
MKRDNYFFGLFLGLLIPMLGVLFFYVILYVPDGVSISLFIHALKTNPMMVSKMLSLGMIACIPLFTFYRNNRMFKTLYGIFGPVLVYAILVIGSRFDIF